MKVHVLQHGPFEDLGSIQGWLEAQSAKVSFTRFYEDPVLPDVDDFDLVIVMGGPMSVNDERIFPWLIEEKRFVAAAVHTGKAVLGICLGAQLIAKTLGEHVYPGPFKEIGWHEIQSVDHHQDSFRFPESVIVFHWHGETFDLPHGAIRLAHSSACQNQAFQVDKRVIGLQFHLETTPRIVDAMISNCGDELVTGPYIQSAREILNVPASSYATINQLMGNILDYRAKGLSQTEAALQAYDVASRESAKALGHTLSKTPDIAAALTDLMEYHGIGRSRRVQKLAEHIENQDPTISLKALDLSFKVDGSAKDRQEPQTQTIALVDLTPFLMRTKEIVITPDD